MRAPRTDIPEDVTEAAMAVTPCYGMTRACHHESDQSCEDGCEWFASVAKAIMVDRERSPRVAWQPIETAPKDGSEVLLHYFDWCGEPLTVSGHWVAVAGRDFDDTWQHSIGCGDADLWQPLPSPEPQP